MCRVCRFMLNLGLDLFCLVAVFKCALLMNLNLSEHIRKHNT